MSLKLYPESAVQDIASAIRAKNGLSTTYNITEMASAISDIPTGGGNQNDVIAGLLMTSDYYLRVTSSSEYSVSNNIVYAPASFFSSFSTLRSGAFTDVKMYSGDVYSFPNLTTVPWMTFYISYNTIGSEDVSYFNNYEMYFDNVTSVGNSAFQRNRASFISIPKLTTLGDYVFSGCRCERFDFPLLESLPWYTFYNCSASIISLPMCTTVGMSAFYNCYSLETVDLSRVRSIANCAFYRCYSLTSISCPSCSTIGDSAFYQCSNLSWVNFESCTTVFSSAFYQCYMLSGISFPLCTTVFASGFYACHSLQTVDLSTCSYIYTYAFSACSGLSTVNLGTCTSVGVRAFDGCTHLSVVSFSSKVALNTSAFYRCYNLLSLYLYGSQVCSLTNVNVFNSTPISTYTTSTGGVYGSIYVPASLVDSYKASTNWVTYAARITSIT